VQKYLGVIAAIALSIWGIKWACESYNAIQADVNTPDNATTHVSPDPVPVPEQAADVPIEEHPIKCSRDIPAFDQAHPEKRVGTFLKGTKLMVGATDSSGLILVTFTKADGKMVRALCRSEDLK
jgi:hypothetical protein